MKLAPALAAGNAIILKTSDTNPLAPLRLAELSIEAGIPPGVVNCITGDVESGSALSSHMQIRKISFTGSIAVGKKVQIDAAKSNLKSVTLELGGKSPLIVFPDAKMEKAAKMCSSFLAVNGQGCVLPTRVYIHESIIDELLPSLKAIIQEYRNNMRSDPLLETTWSMPLLHERQRDSVRAYIETAKKEATVLIDGLTEDPLDPYIGPTVFMNPSSEAKILKEEAFGPVLVIHTFSDVDKVLELANDTEYGLAAYICTRDVGTALRMANRLEAGTVCVNCVAVDTEVPFSGWKRKLILYCGLHDFC
jgi:aldehyde dehydrogenase (NAD+)